MAALFMSARRFDSLNVNGIAPPPARLAPDALGADDNVVEVAFLGRGGARVPVVLEEHRVDAIRAEGPEPVERGLARLQVVVDPELEHRVRQPGVVELGMRFDAVPLPHMARIEQRGHPQLGAKPVEVREVVVLRGQEIPARVGARCGVHQERARLGGIAPQMRDHRLRPVGRRKADRPAELVAAPPPPPPPRPPPPPPRSLPPERPPPPPPPGKPPPPPPPGAGPRAPPDPPPRPKHPPPPRPP